MRFTYHGVSLIGIDEPYNSTILNERAVELAVAKRFLADVDGEGLEVGNVLGHYGLTGHRVVDLSEVSDGVENMDVFDIAGRYDWIVAISTLEHVRWDSPPKDAEAALGALDYLRSLLNPGGRMLVTVPTGYHAPLDAELITGVGAERACTMVRTPKGWRQTKAITVKPYGVENPWASSVWIGEFSS